MASESEFFVKIAKAWLFIFSILKSWKALFTYFSSFIHDVQKNYLLMWRKTNKLKTHAHSTKKEKKRPSHSLELKQYQLNLL